MTETNLHHSTLVGSQAPDFSAQAISAQGHISSLNLHKHIKDKCAVLFFYPLDFTFVCPSELIALHNRIPQFKELNTEVLALSVDSVYTHNAWRKTSVNAGGIGEVDFTMLADLNHAITKAYGIEHAAGVALRATFIIDQKGVIRHQGVNDLPLGRNIDEILRLVEAVQFTDKHGEVCPAGWNKGKAAMKPDAKGVAEYLAGNADKL